MSDGRVRVPCAGAVALMSRARRTQGRMGSGSKSCSSSRCTTTWTGYPLPLTPEALPLAARPSHLPRRPSHLPRRPSHLPRRLSHLPRRPSHLLQCRTRVPDRDVTPNHPSTPQGFSTGHYDVGPVNARLSVPSSPSSVMIRTVPHHQPLRVPLLLAVPQACALAVACGLVSDVRLQCPSRRACRDDRIPPPLNPTQPFLQKRR